MGRIGPKNLQDWYRGCAKAVKLERQFTEAGHVAKIVVVDAAQFTGYPPDSEYMEKALKDLGAKNLLVEPESYETIGELEAALYIAKRESARLVVVSTYGHYLRLSWLIRNIDTEHHIAFGLPRWKELLTDIILTALFPIIDISGNRKWFRDKVIRYRKLGNP